MKRKGDFSNSQLCKLSLTPESKAVIFLAVTPLMATKMQHLRLCWIATKSNLGLRRLASLEILHQKSVPGHLEREMGFSKKEFRLYVVPCSKSAAGNTAHTSQLWRGSLTS